jgi:hypothetical protein
MSIINKMLDLSLQQKVLQSQISDMSYKITNGKKLSNKNFYEGIVNPGTVDFVSAPESKITKEMILDYRKSYIFWRGEINNSRLHLHLK